MNLTPAKALSPLAAPIHLAKGGFLRDTGWYRSYIEKRSVDRHGEPIPWLPYCLISFLQPRLRPDLGVFEYGCGNSTLWWASRVGRIVSCEHDSEWLSNVRRLAPQNTTLVHIGLEYGGAYCHAAVDHGGSFDVVVVDGRDRVRSALNAVSALTPGGVIILDDSDRPQYAEADACLKAGGFRCLEFRGLRPIVAKATQTSIYYRDGNVLAI